jgi:hypothetical protein
MIIRKATQHDISQMVALSDIKRTNYAHAQPQFWRRSENANAVQADWFAELLEKENYFLFVAENNNALEGFIIGQNVKAPEVYNPGGLTLMIDDFCVANDWSGDIGNKLLKFITKEAKEHGAAQLVIVCGQHDENKRKFLAMQNLEIASNWYVKGI